MKISGNAGHNNTFMEFNITGGVTQICPEVKEVITHNHTTPMTLGQMIQSLERVGSKFSSFSIPIKMDGKEIHNLSTNICKDKDENYYIELKIR